MRSLLKALYRIARWAQRVPAIERHKTRQLEMEVLRSWEEVLRLRTKNEVLEEDLRRSDRKNQELIGEADRLRLNHKKLREEHIQRLVQEHPQEKTSWSITWETIDRIKDKARNGLP